VRRAARSSRRNRPVTATAARYEDPKTSAAYCFDRQARLPDEAAFSRVFASGRRSRDEYFTVLCSPNGDRRARLGLAIAKKHCRLAVRRNRLKRIVRESFRQHRQALAGLDIVVLNRPASAAAGNRELFDSLAAHWQRCRTRERRTQG